MTPDLAAIAARNAARTQGKWQWINPETDEPREDGDCQIALRTVEHFGENKTEIIDGKSYTSFSLPKFILGYVEADSNDNMEADLAFIDATSEDIPALLAEVARLSDALAEAENKLTTWEVNYCDLALSEKIAYQRGYDDAKEHAASIVDENSEFV